jgi:hypothetical protein
MRDIHVTSRHSAAFCVAFAEQVTEHTCAHAYSDDFILEDYVPDERCTTLIKYSFLSSRTSAHVHLKAELSRCAPTQRYPSWAIKHVQFN